VSWRWVPPAFSPVAPRTLLSGIAAACGSHSESADDVAEALRARYAAKAALLTDSGTSALTLALRAVVPPGGTVAYPGYSCIDLTTAAVGAGIRVRLYDLDPQTMSPDLDSLAKTVARGVDAIVVAHLYGYPAHMPAVESLAASYGIPVIEDAAQSAGGALENIPLGGFGDISILSFGRGKGATTGGGGAVLLRSETATTVARLRNQLATAVRGSREIGALAAQWILSDPLLYRLPASIPALKLGEMVYHPPRPPRAMPAAAAAMLSAVLRDNEKEVEIRRARATYLLSRINGSGRVVPIRPLSGAQPGFLRLAVTDATGQLEERAPFGILRGYPLTLEQHQPLRPILMSGEKAGKGSTFLRDRLFTLPTHSRVGATDLARLHDWIARSS
jgi:perosamine synthetase